MSYLFRIDLIVVPMRANPFDPYHALLEVDGHQPIVVHERQQNQRSPVGLDALFGQGDMLTGAPQPAMARSFETWANVSNGWFLPVCFRARAAQRSHDRKIMVWKTQARCATV